MIEFNEFGLYFTPDDINTNDKTPTVLIIPSLFEEYRCSHRLLYDFCHSLAQNGIRALFPNLTGLGNDENPLMAANLKVWSKELTEANDFLRATSSFHTLVPFRIGALLIEELIAERYIYWHPALNGQKFLRQLRVRREIQNKITGEVVLLMEGDLEGQVASRALRDNITDSVFNLPSSGEIVLLQQAAGTTLYTEYVQLLNANSDKNIKVVTIIADSYWYPHSPTDYSSVIDVIISEVKK